MFSILLISTSLVAGLYGMNLAGLPFADSPHAFWILPAFMDVVSALLLLMFRRRRLI